MITNLTIGRYGRFANQLFQIAGIIGIARRSGQDFGFLPWMNYDHKERFGSSEDIDLQKYFVNPLPGLNDLPENFIENAVSWGYRDIRVPAGNWNLTGHFQSEKYFKHCIDEVRHYLTMQPFEDGSDFQLDNFLCVHVRRGDYDNHYHTILAEIYYRKALACFPEHFHVCVFSDNMDEAINMLRMANDSKCYIRVENGSYITDFARMKRMNSFICGNSSFSLMAAILSEAPNKKIVCPSNWFGPAWSPDTTDLYPEGAIVI